MLCLENDFLIFHLVILRLQQLAKVLLAVIQHDDLIAGGFRQKKDLGRVDRRIMRHGIHIVDKPQQHPYGKDRPLIRLA